MSLPPSVCHVDGLLHIGVLTADIHKFRGHGDQKEKDKQEKAARHDK